MPELTAKISGHARYFRDGGKKPACHRGIALSKTGWIGINTTEMRPLQRSYFGTAKY